MEYQHNFSHSMWMTAMEQLYDWPLVADLCLMTFGS